MSRRKRKAQAFQRERDILHSKVRSDGKGEDPALAAYLGQDSNTSFTEMAEMSLALDRLLKGDMSMLNDPAQSEKVAKLRARAAAIQDADRRYQEDPQKFIEGLWEKADKVRPRGAKLDEEKAKGARIIQDAVTFGKANLATRKLKLQEMLRNSPKRKIFVTGNPVMTNNGIVIEPEYINIMGFRMVLAPGEHEVPLPFAARHDDMVQSQRENAARSASMSENLRADKLALRWQELDTEFGTRTNPDDMAALNIPGAVE